MFIRICAMLSYLSSKRVIPKGSVVIDLVEAQYGDVIVSLTKRDSEENPFKITSEKRALLFKLIGI